MRLTHKTTSIIPTSTYTWCWYVHNQLQFVKLDRCEDNMTTAIFCSYKLYMREGDKEEGWESGRMREEREVETRYGKSKRGKVRLGGTRSGRGRDGQRQREGKREGEIERAMKRERGESKPTNEPCLDFSERAVWGYTEGDRDRVSGPRTLCSCVSLRPGVFRCLRCACILFCLEHEWQTSHLYHTALTLIMLL